MVPGMSGKSIIYALRGSDYSKRAGHRGPIPSNKVGRKIGGGGIDQNGIRKKEEGRRLWAPF